MHENLIDDTLEGNVGHAAGLGIGRREGNIVRVCFTYSVGQPIRNSCLVKVQTLKWDVQLQLKQKVLLCCDDRMEEGNPRVKKRKFNWVQSWRWNVSSGRSRRSGNEITAQELHLEAEGSVCRYTHSTGRQRTAAGDSRPEEGTAGNRCVNVERQENGREKFNTASSLPRRRFPWSWCVPACPSSIAPRHLGCLETQTAVRKN